MKRSIGRVWAQTVIYGRFSPLPRAGFGNLGLSIRSQNAGWDHREKDMSRWGFFKHALRVALPALAGLLLVAPAHAADEYLDPDKAFSLSARSLDATHIEVRFEIAPGYYLYQERLNAQVAPEGLQLAELRIPKGKVKYDETFEKDVEYFREAVTLVAVLKEAPTGPFKLSVGNQGCADKGL